MSTPQNPPVPEQTVIPSLPIRDAVAALDFYCRAFGAVQTVNLPTPDGKIAHAEIRIGNSTIMLGEENADWNSLSPLSVGGSSTKLLIYVADVDATFKQALEAGAKSLMEPANQFWGDRMGEIIDPFGYRWMLATKIEEVHPDEYPARMAAFFANGGNCGGQ